MFHRTIQPSYLSTISTVGYTTSRFTASTKGPIQIARCVRSALRKIAIIPSYYNTIHVRG